VRSLTREQQGEDDGQLVDGVAQDVLHHRAGDERLLAPVRLAEQQRLGGRLGGQSQRRQGGHDEVDPQHLHSFERRVLGAHTHTHTHTHRWSASTRRVGVRTQGVVFPDLRDARPGEGHDAGDHVDGELELEELGDAVVDVAAPHHGLHDAAEVVVRQDDVRRLLCHVRPGDALQDTRGT